MHVEKFVKTSEFKYGEWQTPYLYKCETNVLGPDGILWWSYFQPFHWYDFRNCFIVDIQNLAVTSPGRQLANEEKKELTQLLTTFLCFIQAILYFSAEAAQFWIPSIRRSASGAARGALGTFSCTAAGDTGAQTTVTIDKSLATGLFLFSGLCMFLARVGRTFWRSPLFRDATAVLGRSDSKGIGPGGLSSWMRRFVHTLATASPLGSGGRNTLPQEQPVRIWVLSYYVVSKGSLWVIFVSVFYNLEFDITGGRYLS